MSQEAPMMPVYIPIIDEHLGVMFVNSSKQLNDTCFSHVLSDIASHDDLLVHEVNDTETFAYRNQIAGSNTPMVEVVYFDTTKVKKVLFDLYAQFEYDEQGNLKAMYKNELEIPTFIDNGASVNVLPKAFYDKHKIDLLHKLPKVSADMQLIMTGNGTIPAYFWIDLPLEIQGIFLQLCCIVCDSTAGHGLLFSRMSLDQMQAIQLYDK